ncbi:MAG: FprA family A-type flavoprotein, partial [Duncaniella sp.]|nr:FprA family A-type flavoprotein [Duncaniella sp.]
KGVRTRRGAIGENGLWAPAAGRKRRGMFEQMKDISIVEPIVTLHGRLTPADIDHLSTLADSLLAEKN